MSLKFAAKFLCFAVSSTTRAGLPDALARDGPMLTDYACVSTDEPEFRRLVPAGDDDVSAP